MKGRAKGVVEYFLQYRNRFIWALISFGVLGLGGLLFWGVASPYDQIVEKELMFHTSENLPKHTYIRAVVTSVYHDKAQVKLVDGSRKGEPLEVSFNDSLQPKVGDRVLLTTTRAKGPSGHVSDFWRLPGIVLLAALFIWLVLLVGGRQGLMSLGGLFISVVVIAFGLVPAILNGTNAFWASVIAAFTIASLAIVTAHGWRWRTIVSLLSIFIVLGMAVGFALLGGWLGNLTGVYDDVSALLRIHESTIDMRGVLVGGIIIATLGVLDDIVTAQTAAIEEIYKAQPKLTYRQLFSHGQSVGREHVAALVNTLALAYIGVSLPVVLSIVLNFDTSKSILLLFNSEFLSQEIVRTLVSSMALVIAVPVSTAVASLLILRKKQIFAILKPSKHKSGGRDAAD